MRRRLKPRIPLVLLLCSSILLSSLPGLITAAIVTLDSIEIYTTHELWSAPKVYFHCKGENKTSLPDVKKKHVLYTFKGEESWQPLTELIEKKCKRCGMYEKDTLIKPDDVFDEWEFCASDFTRPDGKYIHFKEKEFNATFFCPECIPHVGAPSNHTSGSPNKGKEGMHWALVLLICVLVSSVVVLGAVAAYKFWQKRKRQQEQVRFLKLFEEGDDDIDDELGIGPLNHVI